MRNNTLITLAIAAILSLCSLPIQWMTIHNATVNGFNFEGISPMRVTASLNGFNGDISLFGAKLPIWLFILIGVIGLGVKALNVIRISSLPKLAYIGPIVFSLVYTLFALGLAVGSSQTTAGVGGFIALAGLVLGVIIAFKPDQPATASEWQSLQ